MCVDCFLVIKLKSSVFILFFCCCWLNIPYHSIALLNWAKGNLLNLILDCFILFLTKKKKKNVLNNIIIFSKINLFLLFKMTNSQILFKVLHEMKRYFQIFKIYSFLTYNKQVDQNHHALLNIYFSKYPFKVF